MLVIGGIVKCTSFYCVVIGAIVKCISFYCGADRGGGGGRVLLNASLGIVLLIGGIVKCVFC